MTDTAQAQFEARRRNFTSGRRLLRDAKVPFEPDDLLEDDWPLTLRAALDSIPAMHQTRYELGPLEGIYFADTLYLPENVRLSGDTVIIANYVVFEGSKPTIKGSYDLNFFPIKPVVVLGTTVSQLLHSLGLPTEEADSPAFSEIHDSLQVEPHSITFDTSGSTGSPGIPGASGVPGAPGIDQGKAADGDCSGDADGQPGVRGGDGEPGKDGRNGTNGGPGQNGGAINATIPDEDVNGYYFVAFGGRGGSGGNGGKGGRWRPRRKRRKWRPRSKLRRQSWTWW